MINEEKLILTCVYCGEMYPEGTPPFGSDVLTRHIKVCPQHPLREAEDKICMLRNALIELVACDSIDNRKNAISILIKTTDKQ